MNSLIRKYKLFLNLASAVRQSEKTVIYTHQLRHLQLFPNVDEEEEKKKNNRLPEIVIGSTNIVELLKSSYGFPLEEAKALESRLSASHVKKEKKKTEIIENAQNVIEFFRDAGFSNTHIRKVISLRPRVLNSSVEDTLKPKIRAFEDLGLSTVEIRDLIVKNSYILVRKPASMIALLSNLFESKEDVARVFKKNRLHSRWNFGRNLEAQISKYLEHGIAKDKLACFAATYPSMIMFKPQVIEERFQKAYRMGFKYGDGMLMTAVRVIGSMSESTLESKFQVLRSYGWKDDDIAMALHKDPAFLTYSVGRIKRTLKFFMEDLKYEPVDLAPHSRVLRCSLDKRIVPRVNVIKELESKGLLKRKQSPFTFLLRSERRFQKDFLLDIEDEHPELFKSYLKSVQ